MVKLTFSSNNHFQLSSGIQCCHRNVRANLGGYYLFANKQYLIHLRDKGTQSDSLSHGEKVTRNSALLLTLESKHATLDTHYLIYNTLTNFKPCCVQTLLGVFQNIEELKKLFQLLRSTQFCSNDCNEYNLIFYTINFLINAYKILLL